MWRKNEKKTDKKIRKNKKKIDTMLWGWEKVSSGRGNKKIEKN